VKKTGFKMCCFQMQLVPLQNGQGNSEIVVTKGKPDSCAAVYTVCTGCSAQPGFGGAVQIESSWPIACKQAPGFNPYFVKAPGFNPK
jgi:hypothetical protein